MKNKNKNTNTILLGVGVITSLLSFATSLALYKKETKNAAKVQHRFNRVELIASRLQPLDNNQAGKN